MPRTEAGKALAILVPGNYSDLVATIDAIEREASIPDRDALAKALDGAGLVARLTDYAMRAHPDTMARDEPNVAESWADAIIAALKEQA